MIFNLRKATDQEIGIPWLLIPCLNPDGLELKQRMNEWKWCRYKSKFSQFKLVARFSAAQILPRHQTR